MRTRGPARCVCRRQLEREAAHQRFRHWRIKLTGQPGAQAQSPPVRRQLAPSRYHQGAVALQCGHLLRHHLGQHGSGFLRMLGSSADAELGVGERRQQRRPDSGAQPAAGKPSIDIAGIVDPAQPMAKYIRFDGVAGAAQPRAREINTVFSGAVRHRRQPRCACAAQGLQQPGFGLVALVLGQQHQGATSGSGHLRQRQVALTPGPSLHALPRSWCANQTAGVELDAPAPALRPHANQPVVGLGRQAVVHMQRHHMDAQHPGLAHCAMQKRRRIAAAAGRHGDPR